MRKRVYCLYRVSTKGQVEKDDIPMQRQTCHEFSKQNDWDIVKEFTEKGVSGFKVSAKDRDAIQEIQRDAAQDKFDILLVFMFDRLGRKEDETPFVVEWFVKNGIEVWSTVEGQQKFDNHVDKLMNYLRYWQASGESIKTSIRTKTRLGQIVQEGRFRGGIAPYGYELVKRGRMGKKNRELYDIEINPEEATVVRKMYDLADRYGYGGRRISSELVKMGIINERTKEPFHYSSIQSILRNIMYIGILRSGETKSDIFPELQIVEPEQYERITKIREQRSASFGQSELSNEMTDTDGQLTHTFPKKVSGKALLSGNIYCGHCGGRIFASTARKNHHPSNDKIPERVPIYKCYNRTQRKGYCEGPTSYRAFRIDDLIREVLNDVFQRVKSVNEKELIDLKAKDVIQEYRQQLKRTKTDYNSARKELSKWENLMLDSIEGKCVFSPEQVKGRMDSVQSDIFEYTERITDLQNKIVETESTIREIQEQYKQLVSWADIFKDADYEAQKMIASYMIKAVTVSRDYQFDIEFNLAEAQYISGMEMV